MAARHHTPQHRAQREHWAPIVAAGQAWCSETRCLMASRWIPPGTPWDVAHTPDGLAYLGPAHAKCNRSEGASRGNRQRGRSSRRRWVL